MFHLLMVFFNFFEFESIGGQFIILFISFAHFSRLEQESKHQLPIMNAVKCHQSEEQLSQIQYTQKQKGYDVLAYNWRNDGRRTQPTNIVTTVASITA